jgi:hypothetical protein
VVSAQAEQEEHEFVSVHSHHMEDVEAKENTSISHMRLILVYIAACLALLSFGAFILTGDPRSLLGTSVLAYPLYKIIDYYFGRPML